MTRGRKKLYFTSIHVRITKAMNDKILKDVGKFGNKGEVVRNILNNHYGLNNLNTKYKN